MSWVYIIRIERFLLSDWNDKNLSVWNDDTDLSNKKALSSLITFHFGQSERGQLGDERRRSLSRDLTPTRRRSWSSEVTPVLDRPPLPKGTKPWFIQVPQMEVKVKEGEPLTLNCMVDGDPKPVGKSSNSRFLNLVVFLEAVQ